MASINAFKATPCAADKGLFVTFDVRLFTISATLTLLVVIPSIKLLLFLMYATTSAIWSRVVSSEFASVFRRFASSVIRTRISLCASEATLCVLTADAAVPLLSAPTSSAVYVGLEASFAHAGTVGSVSPVGEFPACEAGNLISVPASVVNTYSIVSSSNFAPVNAFVESKPRRITILFIAVCSASFSSSMSTESELAASLPSFIASTRSSSVSMPSIPLFMPTYFAAFSLSSTAISSLYLDAISAARLSNHALSSGALFPPTPYSWRVLGLLESAAAPFAASSALVIARSFCISLILFPPIPCICLPQCSGSSSNKAQMAFYIRLCKCSIAFLPTFFPFPEWKKGSGLM